ncbi:rhomboid-like protein [Streptomyces abikoensis]|uniref:rhomboid-like protein n=1 Tax=Streptomyces abikoensis TaxID=97398 RepID=UPI0033C48484
MTAVDADRNAHATPAAPGRLRTALRRLGRLLPTPTGTPFTFCYGLILLGTAVYADFGDQATVDQLLRDSSTDAAHLTDQPLVVLVASALWVAGGLYSAYGVAFALVLTALERRVGGARTAGVFLVGHVLATLATELPVAGAVAAGQLPESSLHRLDYGISFGLMACIGALSGLVSRPARWAMLGVAGAMCAQDLIELIDPLASAGHPIALLTGIACRSLIRDGLPRPVGARERAEAEADVVPPAAVPPVRAAVPAPLRQRVEGDEPRAAADSALHSR